MKRRGFLSGVVAAFAARLLPRVKPLPVDEPVKWTQVLYGTPILYAPYRPQLLKVESLEATMRVLTFNQAHLKFWKDVPKLPAYSTTVVLERDEYESYEVS